MAQRQRGDLTPPADEKRMRRDDEPTRPDFEQGRKRPVDLALGARVQDTDLQSECAAGCLDVLVGGPGDRGVAGRLRLADRPSGPWRLALLLRCRFLFQERR